MPTPEFHLIVIAGGGLSGLATAWRLHQAGHQPLVLEARDDVGGRIQSFVSKDGICLGDRGPTWVWPDFQPVVQRWLDELELPRYPQFSDGQSVLDPGPGQPPRVGYLPAQHGSERLVGGTRAVVDALHARLPAGTVRTDHEVSGVVAADGRLELTVRVASGVDVSLTAGRLVVTIPPRIALSRVDWHGGLAPGLVTAMQATPTWMAPHAKAVIVFERPFWREAGLSGRIASHAGPLGEVHDHCAATGQGPAALFGFFSWPWDMRQQRAGELEGAIAEQLARAFGPTAPKPVEVLIEDWARNPHVASEADLSGPMMHPDVGPPVLREPHLGGRLWLAGAECAARSPGLIEGALDTADQVATAVLESTRLLNGARS